MFTVLQRTIDMQSCHVYRNEEPNGSGYYDRNREVESCAQWLHELQLVQIEPHEVQLPVKHVQVDVDDSEQGH